MVRKYPLSKLSTLCMVFKVFDADEYVANISMYMRQSSFDL